LFLRGRTTLTLLMMYRALFVLYDQRHQKTTSLR
jgi:hypothetical protein